MIPDTCPSLSFEKGRETDVTRCAAFSPCDNFDIDFYDILKPITTNGNIDAFYLGARAGQACTETERPTRIESSPYMRTEIVVFGGAASLVAPIMLLAAMLVVLF
jgi:hypothetical protein